MDKKQFEELFRTHFEGLCRFAYKYVHDQDTAQEIVHDVFVNFWNKRETIDQDKSLKSYLFTSVYNRSLNRLRDQKKFIDSEVEMQDVLSDHSSNDSDVLIRQSELESRIQYALDGLPQKCREVFMYSRYEDKKYQEIADIMGISVKTVEVQMSKALKHFRTKLADYLPVIAFGLFFFARLIRV